MLFRIVQKGFGNKAGILISNFFYAASSFIFYNSFAWNESETAFQDTFLINAFLIHTSNIKKQRSKHLKYPGIYTTVKNLYESVWGEPFIYTSGNTVMVHIRRLRKKIEENPQDPEIIENVWGKGYRLTYA